MNRKTYLPMRTMIRKPVQVHDEEKDEDKEKVEDNEGLI
jgi:hypothetical protein